MWWWVVVVPSEYLVLSQLHLCLLCCLRCGCCWAVTVWFLGQLCTGRNSSGLKCCAAENPCSEGEGSCDRSKDGDFGCKDYLFCGQNNCKQFGDFYHEDDTCCEKANTTGWYSLILVLINHILNFQVGAIGRNFHHAHYHHVPPAGLKDQESVLATDAEQKTISCLRTNIESASKVNAVLLFRHRSVSWNSKYMLINVKGA